ncbi:MAG TPA: hypothetical protein VEQ84_11550 [Vicinamibacteria bacterium]|nr:hypothetical protein [Vicinamibacteria bacterium]
MKLRNVRTASLAALVATALSCSGGSTPSAPAPAPSATVAAASPSPTAAPSAPASPAATACKYGKGDPDTFCARRNPALLGDVDAAVDRLVQQHPDYFILTDQNGPGGYKVLKPLEYHQGVVSALQTAGFCAETDTTTVSVRNGIDFSEDYDILLATGHIRRGSGSYRQTCTPPSFPLDFADVISYVRVAFYSIRCEAGIEAPRNGEDKLPVGCTGFVTATPKTKDNLDVKEGLIGNRIDWTFEQEGEHVRVNDFPDVSFNKIVTAVNPGHWLLCAEVKGIKGCQFGEVEPDPR